VFQPNKDKLRFFYDGQGFMSLQLNREHAQFIFYDVSGTVLYQWRSSKTGHPEPSVYLDQEETVADQINRRIRVVKSSY
jgi:tartrate-resistant acid phosphatase type 5